MVSEWLREISKTRTVPKNENLHLCLYLSEKTATGKRRLTVAMAVRKCSQCEGMQQGEIQGNKYRTSISSHFPITCLSLVKWTVKPFGAAHKSQFPEHRVGCRRIKRGTNGNYPAEYRPDHIKWRIQVYVFLKVIARERCDWICIHKG